jgi:hypothetical protein
MLKPEYRRMGAFSIAARIRIVDKAPFENRLNDVTKSVMYHAITERRSLDDTLFGIIHNKFAVPAMPVYFMRQFPPQREEVFLKPVAKFQNGAAIALARTRIAIGGVEVFEIDNLRKKIGHRQDKR